MIVVRNCITHVYYGDGRCDTYDGHDPTKWEEFRARYFEELDTNPTGVSELLSHVGDGPVTFLFSSKEMLRNNAHALQEYVSKVLD